MKSLIFTFIVFFNLTAFAIDCNPQTEGQLFTQSITESSDRLRSLPGLGCITDIELAGLLPATTSLTQRSPKLFYWFVESRSHKASAPIVLWLNGGPGAASTYGFFMETGPYYVTSNMKLLKRQHSWSNQANFLMIDQPASVGLSYSKKGAFVDEAEAMDQLYQTLVNFYKRYPELRSKELFVAGQSYAGKYIPELSMRILSGNEAGFKINLKGVLIGDGWVNPLLQQSTDADFAFSHGLIDNHGYKKISALYQQCAKEIAKQTPTTRQANRICSRIQSEIQKLSGGLNLANIQTEKQADDSNMVRYLNQIDVHQALHIPSAPHYQTFSSIVADAFEIGEQDSVAKLYPILLEKGVRVLVYNGLADGKDCNFLGTDKWLSALTWPHQKEFANASTCVWHVNQNVAGYAKTSSGLTQVKIRNAGHIAPMDQPKAVLDLLNKFIKDQPLC